MGMPVTPTTVPAPGVSADAEHGRTRNTGRIGPGAESAAGILSGILPGLELSTRSSTGKESSTWRYFSVSLHQGMVGAVSGGAEAALWSCIFRLWVYMPIDAYRTAKARLRVFFGRRQRWMIRWKISARGNRSDISD